MCEKYLDYPIISWRNLFYDIANRLAEYDGEEMKNEDDSNAKKELAAQKDKKGDPKSKNEQAADKESILTVEL